MVRVVKDIVGMDVAKCRSTCESLAFAMVGEGREMGQRSPLSLARSGLSRAGGVIPT